MTGKLILVRGGGDLGSGVTLRLWRCGFRVIVLEQSEPVAVRRAVSFSEAVHEGACKVEEAEARLVSSVWEAQILAENRIVSVLIDPLAHAIGDLDPHGVVDAIMAKRNTGSRQTMSRAVVALGPGFEAAVDCDAVVETNRGPNLGRVIWQGCAEPDTGEPGDVAGRTSGRVLRSPGEGRLATLVDIGDIVDQGAPLAEVSGMPVRAPFRGVVRGLLRSGALVSDNMKIGDLDPRPDPALCFKVSDKSLAVAGGVVEALCMLLGEPT